MKQNLSSAKEKHLTTQNSVSSENIIQEWKRNKDIIR